MEINPWWAALVAAVLLGAVIALVCLFWAIRERKLRKLAGRWGARFYERGSSDAEMEFVKAQEGDLKTKVGVERAPLLWKDLEGFPLFDRKTHGARMLTCLIERNGGGGRVVAFDYQYVELTDGAVDADIPAARRDMTVIYQEKDRLALPGLDKERWGEASVAYRGCLLLGVERLEELLRS